MRLDGQFKNFSKFFIENQKIFDFRRTSEFFLFDQSALFRRCRISNHFFPL